MNRILVGGAFAIALALFASQSAQAQYVTYHSYSVGYAPTAVYVPPPVYVQPVVRYPVATSVYVRPAPVLTPVRTVARPVVRAATAPFRPRVVYRFGY